MQSEWANVRNVIFTMWKDFFVTLFTAPFPWKETFKQVRKTINDGWATMLSGSIVQGIFVMWIAGLYGKMFGGYIWVGAVTTFAVFREFAVLMSGVLYAGRIGTAFTVEIGSMQISEQIHALRLMNVNPITYLVIPRVMASFIVLPLFTAFSFSVAILSSWVLMAIFWDLSFPIFFQNAFLFVQSGVLTNSLIRSFVIGLVVGLNAVALGFSPGNGAEDLGRSTTKSIVINLFCVLLIDLIIGMMAATMSLGGAG